MRIYDRSTVDVPWTIRPKEEKKEVLVEEAVPDEILVSPSFSGRFSKNKLNSKS